MVWYGSFLLLFVWNEKSKYHWDATGRHTVFTMTFKVCPVILNPFTKSMAPAFTLWNAITKWTCSTIFTVVTPTKHCNNEADDLSLHLFSFKFIIYVVYTFMTCSFSHPVTKWFVWVIAVQPCQRPLFIIIKFAGILASSGVSCTAISCCAVS